MGDCLRDAHCILCGWVRHWNVRCTLERCHGTARRGSRLAARGGAAVGWDRWDGLGWAGLQRGCWQPGCLPSLDSLTSWAAGLLSCRAAEAMAVVHGLTVRSKHGQPGVTQRNGVRKPTRDSRQPTHIQPRPTAQTPCLNLQMLESMYDAGPGSSRTLQTSCHANLLAPNRL